MQRFEPFVVVRASARDTIEVHVVGASGTALDEVVGQINDCIVDHLAAITHGIADSLEDIELAMLGNHPDVATGISVRCDGATALRTRTNVVKTILSNHFEHVMEAA